MYNAGRYQIYEKFIPRGMSAIEIIVILAVLSIVFAIYFVKTGNPVNDSVRARALLPHMKLVANAAENQK